MNVMSLIPELFTLKSCIVKASTVCDGREPCPVLKFIDTHSHQQQHRNFKTSVDTETSAWAQTPQIMLFSKFLLGWADVTVFRSLFPVQVQVSEPLCDSNVCPQNGIGFPVQ